MATVVNYHDGKPAICVKVRAPGAAFCPDELDGRLSTQTVGDKQAEDIVESAYGVVQRYFWDVAESMAAPVLGSIRQDGRSGGWLVIEKDPTHGGDTVPDAEWLTEYGLLRDWAAEFIETAPERVARLALDMARDELGRGPACRLFMRA